MRATLLNIAVADLVLVVMAAASVNLSGKAEAHTTRNWTRADRQRYCSQRAERYANRQTRRTTAGLGQAHGALAGGVMVFPAERPGGSRARFGRERNHFRKPSSAAPRYGSVRPELALGPASHHSSLHFFLAGNSSANPNRAPQPSGPSPSGDTSQ